MAASYAVDDDLVLVYGTPQRMAVLNAEGARLWRMLSSRPRRTAPDTPADRFCRHLHALGLLNPTDGGEGVTAVGQPEIIHEGEVEIVVYGVTGGPIEKPGLLQDPLDPEDVD